MESAMTSEATPAVTPMTEITVITPITACRRLARRYRAATKSSNLMPPSLATLIASCGGPLKWQRDQRNMGFVLAIALPKSFFQFAFFDPYHQGKCSEGADCQQNKAHQKTTAHAPASKIQQMRDIYWMTHAGVQSCRNQFLRMFLRTQLGFAAEFVRPEPGPYPAIDPETKKHQEQCR